MQLELRVRDEVNQSGLDALGLAYPVSRARLLALTDEQLESRVFARPYDLVERVRRALMVPLIPGVLKPGYESKVEAETSVPAAGGSASSSGGGPGPSRGGQPPAGVFPQPRGDFPPEVPYRPELPTKYGHDRWILIGLIDIDY